MADYIWVKQGNWNASSRVTLWDGSTVSIAGKEGRIDFSPAAIGVTFDGADDNIDASNATSGVAFAWFTNGATRFDAPTRFTLSGHDDVLSLINKGASETDDYGLGISVNAGAGNDLVLGGSQDDLLNGANGNDRLYGGGGTDSVFGQNGDDQLHGGAGGDDLRGGNNVDTLTGGLGADTLAGGTGNDVFTFLSNHSTAAARDTITDFQDGSDRLEIQFLSSAQFNQLTITPSGGTTLVGHAITGFQVQITNGAFALTVDDFAFPF